MTTDVSTASATSTPPTGLDELRSGFASPASGAAPLVRWWWFGPAVDRAEIDRELAAMAAAGLGGVEVAYVYPLSEDADTFLAPSFLADLRHAAGTARREGLRFDLTLGSGWSFGGPHVTAQHAARRLVWDRRELSPGAATIPVGPAWPGDELVAAYLGPGSLQEPPEELTRLPVVEGAVQVPDGTGTRQVLLAWAQLTGQNVKRAARGAEGPVLDHYSVAATREHLRRVGEPLLDAVPGRLLGSVFCDSLEVYGSDWTSDLAAQFRRRRGYDLLPELYRLVVDGAEAARLRADYHRTLCELYEENFVAVVREWAAEHDVAFRIQGYGTPPAMISSYRHADLFEGEGWGWTELTQTRWASSAAHAYGRSVVSSETWTWVHSPSYRATPLDLQGEAHEHFLAGVNQLIGHGWPYSPSGRAIGGATPGAGGLGWLFYASGALDDRNPWWPAMPALTGYLARLCWLLRQGQPVADVLLHVSSEDVFARMGTAVGGSLDAWREARLLVGDEVVPAVRQSGRDFDLLDDTVLAELAVDETRPVVLAGATRLSADARSRLEQHAAGGGTVITVDCAATVVGARTCDGPGLAALLAAGPEPSLALDPGVSDVGLVRRRTGDAVVCLVVNTGPERRSVALRHHSPYRGFEEWDARSGSVVRAGAAGSRIEVELHPYQATVLVLTDEGPPVPAARSGPEPGRERRVALDGGWRVRFADDPPVDVALPHVWEDDAARRAYSGRATYLRTVDLPDLGPSGTVSLDLGEARSLPQPADPDPGGLRGHSFRARIETPVGVAAEVGVNGAACGVLWAPPYVLDVTAAARPGSNELEVVVTNTAANALAADQQLSATVATSERRHGRRFRMQELELAMDGVRSGLFGVPTLVLHR